ncbi:MAG: metal-dependent transcriptional regulator [Anaerotignum sp.]|nr:metal-dependent transcriptional regulator [Anaerotignum sp.]MBR5122315.1 metal-dependent transcriptional regulator [Anaerotignum sp.]MBR6541719.1 metal-dependent transcriptional regulator [Anaerotignum sp.]
MKTQESMENYLETIYVLDQKTGFVRSVDVATEMGFSKPSISNAMKKLKAEGYVQIEDKGRIVLTEKGRQVAENTYEKHCVISHWLMHIGVSRETAMEDACRMEHILSQESFECMKKHHQIWHELNQDADDEIEK